MREREREREREKTESNSKVQAIIATAPQASAQVKNRNVSATMRSDGGWLAKTNLNGKSLKWVRNKKRKENQFQTDRDDVKTCLKVGTHLGWAERTRQSTPRYTKQVCRGEALVQRMDEPQAFHLKMQGRYKKQKQKKQKKKTKTKKNNGYEHRSKLN